MTSATPSRLPHRARRLYRWATLVVLLMGGLLAAPPFDAAGAGWPHETSDLAPDPDVTFGRLPNGFRYVLMPNRTPRARVSMHLNIQAGSLQESDDQQGLAHFLEHMLFNGSTHFPPGELVKYFQSIGMQFGPDANAHTGFDETVYDVLLPDGSRASIEKGLLVLRDYADGALLLPAEIDRERKVILAEKRTRDSASYRTFVATFQFGFAGTRVSRRLPIGVTEVLEKAGQVELTDYYETWYRPDRMVLVMVGDFDLPTATAAIHERFASLAARRGTPADPDPGRPVHAGDRFFYHHEKEAGKTRVSIEVLRRVAEEPDTAVRRHRELLQDMADRMVQNRLDTLLGKPDTPFTAARVGSGRYLGNFDYAEISADCDPQRWADALSRIEQVLRQALAYGFTAAELDRVKKDFQSELDTALKQAGTRNSRDLARSIIRSVNTGRVFKSPVQEKALLAGVVDAATLDAVAAALRRNWPSDHRLVLVTGSAPIGDKTLAADDVIRGVYHNSQQVAVARPSAAEAPTFPYLATPSSGGLIVQREHSADTGITRVAFGNGLHLNLKPTDFKEGEVLATVIFGDGRASQPLDKPGLAVLAEALVNESGLGRLTKDDLEQALAGKNSRVDFSVEDQWFALQGRTVPGELDLLFPLLYAHLQDPGMRADAFSLVMQRFEQAFGAMSRSPDGAMELQGNRFLAGGDPRFGLPPHEKFQTLTLGDVRTWLLPAFKTAPLEISVVGDFDTETVVQTVARYFGSLAARPAPKGATSAAAPQFPEDQRLVLDVKTDIPKGLVVVAYPTDDFWDIHRTRRLSVLSQVFSDRLRLQVREKLGAAYSPHAYNWASRAFPGFGILRATVSVDPQDAERIAAEVRDIAAGLARDGVSADECRRAVEPILTSLKEMQRTNTYWLDRVLTGSARYPQQLDWSRSLTHDYQSITVADLSGLARRYLDNRRSAEIIVRPTAEGGGSLADARRGPGR
ncbi:MAG: insulinase family protein [Desulfobacterales bacterium]